MNPKRKFASIALLVLLGVAVYGVILTGVPTDVPTPSGKTPGIAPQVEMVDHSALLTAQSLARLPITAAELQVAQAALQLGDQEMDLAFASAVLDVTQHPPVLSAEAKKIQAQLQIAEDALAAQEAQVAQLTVADGKANGARKDSLDDQLDLAKAELELRQDEVDDSEQDLIRAGGDPGGRIAAMVQEHQAASEASDSTKVAVSAAIEPRGLVQRFQQWSALHRKQLQLWRAKEDALSAATAFTAKHNSLDGEQTEPQTDKAADDVAPAMAPSMPAAVQVLASLSRQDSAAIVAATKRRAVDTKTASIFDKRIGNENQLAGVYGQWIAVVAAQQRAIINRGLRGLLIVLAITIVGIFVDHWIASLLGKSSMDRRQVETLRTVVRGTMQVLGLFLLLLLIFGPPNQLGTFLGLLGAGLTVALQSFILAFFGRFVLMGRHGIRIGDWVEIEGVTGEVVELGFFHTVLLETGNWTESGHPTGRRVTFTNSFAVAGHYFNFSTSGQWLWDELQIALPAGQNPYPIVEAIQRKVMEVTSESTQQAEQEWKGAANSRDTKALSAAPTINVKPVIGGTEISIRYITHANQRSELRAKLNHAAVDLLGPGNAPRPASDSPETALTSR